MPVASHTETWGPVTRLHMSRAVAGKALYFTSVYHWGTTLIDCGARTGERALAAFLGNFPVTDALITHGHEDHVGNAALLAARGVRLHAPQQTVESLKAPSRVPFYRRFVWGDRDAAPAEPLPPAMVLDGKRFRVVHTPGHAPDHVSFFETETGWAFVGDAYLGKLRMARPEDNVPQWLATMRAIRALAPERVFPTHGPVLTKPAEALSEAIEHLERIQRTARALRDRGLSMRAIRKEILGPEPILHYVSRGEFSAERLVESLLDDPEQPVGATTSPYPTTGRADLR